MALRSIDHQELSTILEHVIARAEDERPTTALIFQLLFATGLRVEEVLETWRWLRAGPEAYTVQLSKREDLRTISASLVPPGIAPYIEQRRPFELETYSAVNNSFKKYAPGIIIENKKRRTTCHAFRYNYIKQLYATGLTVSEVAAHMGHKVEASSAGYILAQVRVGPYS